MGVRVPTHDGYMDTQETVFHVYLSMTTTHGVTVDTLRAIFTSRSDAARFAKALAKDHRISKPRVVEMLWPRESP